MAIDRVLGTEIEDDLVDGYRESYSHVKITPTKDMVIDRLRDVDVGLRKAEQEDILEKLQNPVISFSDPICRRAIGMIARFHDSSIQVSGMCSRVCPQCLEIVPRRFAVCAKCLVKFTSSGRCEVWAAPQSPALSEEDVALAVVQAEAKASKEISTKYEKDAQTYAASNVPMVPEVDMEEDEDIVMAGAITAPDQDDEIIDVPVTDQMLLELGQQVLGRPVEDQPDEENEVDMRHVNPVVFVNAPAAICVDYHLPSSLYMDGQLIRLIRRGFAQWRAISGMTEHQLQSSFRDGKRHDCPGIWPVVAKDPATNRPRPITHQDCVSYYVGEKGTANDYADMKYASYQFGRFMIHDAEGEKGFDIEFSHDPRVKERHDTLSHAMVARLMGQVFYARYYSYFRGNMGYEGYFHINPSGMATRDSGSFAREALLLIVYHGFPVFEKDRKRVKAHEDLEQGLWHGPRPVLALGEIRATQNR